MGADLSFPQVEISPDRTYIVTGGNTGIGYCAATEIAQMGGHVIIACRNMSKAETAVKKMKEEYEKEFREKHKDLLDTKQEPRKLNLDIMELDLASFDKTMKFVEEFKARNCSLHGLICNAGIFMQEKVMTDDGYEMMLQSNYLSHLLIILHFLPILQKSEEDARIVQTSSVAYEMGKFDESNINADKSFSAFGFYSNSKLYQIMSMYWLTRHLKDKSVTINSCHPGFVKTQMTESYWLMRMFIKVASRNPNDGASTIIKAAIDPSLKAQTGLYLADCKIKATSSYSMNVENQDKLMAYSFQVLENYLPQDIKEYVDM
ncbi:dehydrogenase/reductase SDR family member on chromosome X-like [Patella vulgata]|uniref:dehydrogenase/reductase SDR family member on chromosome X-like n=1 Tax=Patella vulgata TaxID=6465 RepID=UPI00217FC1F7|nr:dehydrogenase/reductase SDR family member on chromosome X-like [Patella vulgata]